MAIQTLFNAFQLSVPVPGMAYLQIAQQPKDKSSPEYHAMLGKLKSLWAELGNKFGVGKNEDEKCQVLAMGVCDVEMETVKALAEHRKPNSVSVRN